MLLACKEAYDVVVRNLPGVIPAVINIDGTDRLFDQAGTKIRFDPAKDIIYLSGLYSLVLRDELPSAQVKAVFKDIEKLLIPEQCLINFAEGRSCEPSFRELESVKEVFAVIDYTTEDIRELRMVDLGGSSALLPPKIPAGYGFRATFLFLHGWGIMRRYYDLAEKMGTTRSHVKLSFTGLKLPKSRLVKEDDKEKKQDESCEHCLTAAKLSADLLEASQQEASSTSVVATKQLCASSASE